MTALIGNPLLLTSAPADDDAYQIEKSLRFNEADSPYLGRVASNRGNNRTWTWSGWVKRGKLTANQTLFNGYHDGSNKMYVKFTSTDELYYASQDGGTWAEGTTVAKYRDPSAWMHVVIAVNTTDATAADRFKIYVNGELKDLTSVTSPSQNANTWVNGETLSTVGALRDTSYGQGCDLLLSDVQFIDGLALSPAAFGSFDSTGVWNPKAFALPAPNTGVTWSGMITGSVHSASSATYAFDGLSSTVAQSANGSELVFTPTDGIDFTTFELEYSWCAEYGSGDPLYLKVNDIDISSELKVNDGTGDNCSNNYYAQVLLSKFGITKINTIKWSRQSDGDQICVHRIIIDGVTLVDGQTDQDTYPCGVNDDGTKYSDYWTGTPSWNSNYEGEKAFDGTADLTSGGTGAYTTDSTATWQPPTPIPVKDKLRVLFQKNGSGGTATVNGTDVSGSTAEPGVWITIAGATQLTSVVHSGSSNANWLKAIEVDGRILTDNSGANRYHLKFNDTTTNAALGYDSLGTDFTESHVEKGGPILKTNIAGDTVTSSYNTDANKSNLVLALPGNTLTDVHHTVKGSGSAKSLTNDGVTVSTDDSKHYGSSLLFDSNRDDDLSITGDADFAFGTGDFCVEFWVKNKGNVNYHNYLATRSANAAEDGWCIATNSSGILYAHSNGAMAGSYSGEHTLPLDKWCHVAYTRASGTHRLFLNGVAAATASTTSRDYTNDDLTIGTNPWGPEPGTIYSYMQDIRIYKGAAKYTANFTPPTRNDFTVNNLDGTTGTTTPAGAATGGLPILNVTTSAGTAYSSPVSAATDGISNKQLYLPFQGGNGGSTFTDYSGNNRTPDDVTGTPSTSTGSSKFGGVSGYFDGTTDYLKWDQAAWQISANTTDWTVEFWFRWDSGDSGARGICGMLGNGGNNQSWFVALDSNHKIKTEMYLGGSWRNITCDNAISADTWTHVSCCVHGGTYTMYINGTAQSTTVSGISGTTSLPPAAEPFYIGTLGHSSYSEFKGYIQDFRLVDDGLHTGNFTVPGTVPYFTPHANLDSLVDSPTNYESDDGDTGVGGEVRGNFCTWNPLDKSSTQLLFNGNLDVGADSDNWQQVKGTIGVNSGKYYWEITAISGTQINAMIGISDASEAVTTYPGDVSGYSYVWGGNKYEADTYTASVGNSWDKDDVIGIVLDCDGNTIKYYINNNLEETSTISANKTWFPAISVYYSSSDIPKYATNFGQRAFKYNRGVTESCETLCTKNFDNLFDSETSENNPSKYFDALHYVGNGAATRAMKTAGGFGPDFVWWKRRTQETANIHKLYSRGIADNHIISSDTKNAQGWDEDAHGYLDSLDADGYTIKDGSSGGNGTNEDGDSYISWMWDAGTTAATASTDGSITPSEQWVNATAGFSITKWTATNANATIGHGLGAPPEFIILKNIDAVVDWGVYHVSLGNTGRLKLNTTDGTSTHSTFWQDTSPTNTVFSVGTSGDFNGSTNNIIAWSWAPIAGYSAFGKYTGNSDADGPFQYCGFKPRYLLVKSLAASRDWLVWDSARTTANGALRPNEAVAELTGNGTKIDLLSNGFKLRTDYTNMNAAEDHIWAAFAEHPFKTARAK